jgi:oxygen-independent coproporphyrinogen-3 oxidase
VAVPRRASVYVHFPWCLAKCPYCDFVSYAQPRESIDGAAYADAVLRELETRATAIGAGETAGPDAPDTRNTPSTGKSHGEALVAPERIGSVFFGGGTPSLWDPRDLGRVLAGIRTAFACDPDLEVTVECNPTSLDRVRADGLAAAGVNRLSIGTQSLDESELRFLGRLHDPAGALAAIDAALASDVPRISTDLIFGLPGQAPGKAKDQAATLADRTVGGRRLSHLSCYQLTIEPNTQFGALAKRGRLPLADDGLVAEAFLAIDDALGARGFRHYEISNYALAGEEARHNLGYWRGEEYIGLGCAAYGMIRTHSRGGEGGEGRGVRYRNKIDPRAYVEATRSGRNDRIGQGDGISTSSEDLDAVALLRERIMLGLRLEEGFDLDACGDELGIDPWTPERARTTTWLVDRQRVTRDGGRLRVPRDAWLFTDDTAARLF